MDSEQLEAVQRMIDEAVAPLRTAISALSAELELVVKKVDEWESTDFADADHYHDEYANADHVERSEGDFRRQLSRLRDGLDNLEYRVNDVERKAENALRSADDARRGW